MNTTLSKYGGRPGVTYREDGRLVVTGPIVARSSYEHAVWFMLGTSGVYIKFPRNSPFYEDIRLAKPTPRDKLTVIVTNEETLNHLTGIENLVIS